jgi:hypothetical protein
MVFGYLGRPHFSQRAREMGHPNQTKSQFVQLKADG